MHRLPYGRGSAPQPNRDRKGVSPGLQKAIKTPCGARTRACRVRTPANTKLRKGGVHTSVNAARLGACATVETGVFNGA
jgi:hypothetical protein